MYTQCPDCDTAFRVTARVLQQAAGRVRCGRCGHPFNALERLSEDPPGTVRDDSRSMLDELDALAGPEEVRIEDTGVEWRVIDDDDVDAPDTGAEQSADETDSSAVRWYIEDPDQDAAGNDAASSGTANVAPLQQEEDERVVPARHGSQRSLRLPAADGDEEELRYDDNTPLPDDFGEDPEPAEPPRRRAEDFVELRSRELDERQVDLALGEPGEWMELLDELGSGEHAPAADRQSAEITNPEDTRSSDMADTDIRPLDEDEPEQDAGDGFPRDIDTQFDLQALEMGIDLTGNSAPGEGSGDGEATFEDDADAPGFAPDRMAAGEVDGDMELRIVDDEMEELELATDTDGGGEMPAAAAPVEVDEADPGETGARIDEQRPAPPGPAPGQATPDRTRAQEPARQEPPPLTEDELTINRLIDQDLMRFAEEQEASTVTGMRSAPRKAPHVETIIMEGEFVRTALEGDDDLSTADPGDGRENGAAESPTDTWLENQAATREEEMPAAPRIRGAIAGAVVLGVLLLVQVVHAYRDSLATNGAFERAAGPVYRLLGEPLVPDWDARGWQFQATNGGTDATGEVLNISSQIANVADRALPYPLIYLSLTDRWEEPVGASVLEPLEYLAPDADSTAAVPAGESFMASITIRALSPDATGFKLNVCYPADAGRLRCAIEDFRK